jgi:tetratricopeptide (TPR) repeat protein
MPRVRERAVPHGTFTEHWIRKPAAASARPAARRSGEGPIEPYFDRDRTGPGAKVYQGMGAIVYANLANDGRVLGTAAAALDAALGRDTTHGDAHFLLGVAYQQLGRNGDAIRALEQSVRSDSSHPDRLRALAQAYERAERPPTAIDDLYRRALALQPALAWIRADYADFLQAAGRRDEAEKAYRMTLAEQPSLAVAWFNLGTLLAEERRLDEASDAFQHAVDLDPSLGQALSPLLEIRTKGKVVTGVGSLGSPLQSLLVRDRGPRAVQLSTTTETGGAGIRFFNVPPRAQVQILEPDGTLVRALPANNGLAREWDLLTETGTPIAGGLYRVRVQGRDASGRPFPPQLLYFGIVRQRVE